MSAVEPWDQDATLFKPLEEQVLIGENASALAVQAYLQMCGLKTKVRIRLFHIQSDFSSINITF